MCKIDQDEIVRLTQEYGGAWGINHTRRLLELVESIAADEPYGRDVVWLAAHLHDWGAYHPWARTGVDHTRRSLDIVGPFLAGRGYPEELCSKVLECIAFHQSRGAEPTACREAILFHDADVLDFLGVVGIVRDFSKNPRDLKKGYQAAIRRREELPQTLFLKRSAELAKPRLREMDAFLAAFEAESFGWF
jgi:HD superfamily phosphodiesterase